MALRNPDINYRHGWFFVTTQVTHNKSVFGVIAEDKCILNKLGRKVDAHWLEFFKFHPEFKQDVFVVMPNHFHAIIKTGVKGKGYKTHLSRAMQIFKSITANEYLKMCKSGKCPDIGSHLWYSSYYDNLITTHDELERIRNYIRDNPAQWEKDRFGPITSYSVGNLELLNQPLIAYVASEGGGDAPPARYSCGDKLRKGGDAPPARYSCGDKLRKGGDAPPIISTFTSPQERRLLAYCHASQRCYVHVLPAGIPEELPAVVRTASKAGRALLLSPLAPGTRLNKQRAVWCNQYVLRHASEIWHGYIRPGGTLETLLQKYGREHGR